MLIGIICVFGVVGFWSVTSILVKIALGFVDPFTLAFVRLLLGLAVFSVMYAARKGSWRRLIRREPWLLAGAAGLALNYVCFILSLRFTSAGAGGLVVQSQFVVLAVLAALVLKERLGFPKILGIAAVIGGILTVFGATGGLSDAMRSEYALGNTIMLIAGIGWGVYALSNKALSGRLGNLEILIPVFVIAVVISGIFAVINFNVVESITAKGVFVIAGLGLMTGAGFWLMSEALRRLSGALVGTITATTPLLTLVLAYFILGEPLRPLMFASGFLIISGVIAIALTEWKNNQQRRKR